MKYLKINRFRLSVQKYIFYMLFLGFALVGSSETIFASTSNETQTKLDRRIDVLDLNDTTVEDAFILISQKSGLNIVLGQGVGGHVNIRIKDASIEDIIKVIAEANGLAYYVENGFVKIIMAKEFRDRFGYEFGREMITKIFPLKDAKAEIIINVLNQLKSQAGRVVIDTQSNTVIVTDEASKMKEIEEVIKLVDVPIETKVFQLTYGKVEDLADKLSELITPTLGYIKFDIRTNRIVIADTLAKIEKIGEIIEAFDVQQKEVLIEAKIVQIVLSDEFQLGVDWQSIMSNYHELTLTSNFDVLEVNDKKGTVSVGTVNDEYSFLVEALRTIGKTNLLSSPKILALHNTEAKILVGSSSPYVTSTTTTTASGPATTSETVNFIEVGVKLYVTPFIHDDGFVTMKIRPEVSSVVSTISTGSNNSIPVVDTSEAEAVVRAKDGVTIVIGGLIKEENISNTNKVPLLGNIPVLGRLFSNQSDLIRKTEIAIFLTPKIMTGESYFENRIRSYPDPDHKQVSDNFDQEASFHEVF